MRPFKCMVMLFWLASVNCSGTDDVVSSRPGAAQFTTNTPARNVDPAVLAMGRAVFEGHCSRCHGARAQGAPNWRQRDQTGFFPPPPLDSSGHAWHHSRSELKHMIRFGSEPGKGNMPAWDKQLSEQQIDAVIAYIQSLWSEAVYSAWYDMHGVSN